MQMAMWWDLYRSGKEEKKWWCLYPRVCVSGGSQSRKNKREVGATRKRRDAKEKKNQKRRNKNQDAANADRVVWQDVLRRSITSNSSVSICACVYVCICADWLDIWAFNPCLFMSLIILTDFDHLYTDTHMLRYYLHVHLCVTQIDTEGKKQEKKKLLRK